MRHPSASTGTAAAIRSRLCSPPKPKGHVAIGGEALTQRRHSCPAYVQDIHNEFLTGRYAPYVSSSAMLGYLLRGSPAKVFDNIEAAIACRLQPHPAFSTRHHRISDHSRNLTRADFASGLFQCHHLILEMAYDTQTAGAP